MGHKTPEFLNMPIKFLETFWSCKCEYPTTLLCNYKLKHQTSAVKNPRPADKISKQIKTEAIQIFGQIRVDYKIFVHFLFNCVKQVT